MIEIDAWHQIDSKSSSLINEAKTKGYKYIKIRDKEAKDEKLLEIDTLDVFPNVIKGKCIHYETGKRNYLSFPFHTIDSISFCNSEYKTGYIVDKDKIRTSLKKAILNEDYIEIEVFDHRREYNCINKIVLFHYYDDNGNKFNPTSIYRKFNASFYLHIYVDEIISLRVRQERNFRQVDYNETTTYSQDEIEGDDLHKYNSINSKKNLTEKYLKADISSKLSNYKYPDIYKYMGIIVNELKIMPDSLKRRKLIVYLLEESKALVARNSRFDPICYIQKLKNIDPYLTKIHSENGLKFIESAEYSKKNIIQILKFNEKYNA